MFTIVVTLFKWNKLMLTSITNNRFQIFHVLFFQGVDAQYSQSAKMSDSTSFKLETNQTKKRTSTLSWLVFKITYYWRIHLVQLTTRTHQHWSSFFFNTVYKILLVYFSVLFFPSVATYKTIEFPYHQSAKP